MILQRTPGRLKSFILILHDVEDCDPKRHDAGKAECRKAQGPAPRVQSTLPRKERRWKKRTGDKGREGRAARHREAPGGAKRSVLLSFKIVCIRMLRYLHLRLSFTTEKLNNRNRISPQSEKYIARKRYFLCVSTICIKLHRAALRTQPSSCIHDSSKDPGEA